jgi:hypothetical protein
MIQVTNLKVESFEVGQRTITWEVVSTDESLSDYEIDVYRGEFPTTVGEFDVLISGVEPDTGTWVDSGLEYYEYTHNRKAFYILRTRDLTSADDSFTTPFRMQSEPDLQALEIIRRHNIVFSNPRYSGRSVVIVKKRTWGTFCTTCFDTVTQRVDSTNCTDCYGTGISGGYSQPISLRAMISDKPSYRVMREFGEWQDTYVLVTLPPNPDVVPGDILIDEFNRRFTIISPVRHVQKGLYTLQQQCRAKEVQKGDIVYTIPSIPEMGFADGYGEGFE